MQELRNLFDPEEDIQFIAAFQQYVMRNSSKMVAEQTQTQQELDRLQQDREILRAASTRDPRAEHFESVSNRLSAEIADRNERILLSQQRAEELRQQHREIDDSSELLKQRWDAVRDKFNSQQTKSSQVMQIMQMITGIRWNYEEMFQAGSGVAVTGTVSGTARSVDKSRVRSFELQAFRMSDVLLADRLWSEVQTVRPSMLV